MPVKHQGWARRSAAVGARNWPAWLYFGLVLLGTSGALAATDSIDWQARRERLLAMPPEQKARLYHNQERLAALPAAEQQKLRTLAGELETDPQREHLQHVLVRYHEWLKKLSPGQRATLLELPAEKRLAKIKEMRAEQSSHIHQESAAGEPVTVADFNHILKWIEGYAWKHRDLLLANSPPEMQKQFERLSESRRHRAILWLLAQRWRGGQDDGLPPISEPEIAILAEKLSNQARDRLKNTAGIAAQRQLVHHWVRAALRHRLETQGIGRQLTTIAQQDWERFFEHDLTSAEREQLLSLPPDKMQRELRRLYFLRPGHAIAGQTPPVPADTAKPASAAAKPVPAAKHHKSGKEKLNGKKNGQRQSDVSEESTSGDAPKNDAASPPPPSTPNQPADQKTISP